MRKKKGHSSVFHHTLLHSVCTLFISVPPHTFEQCLHTLHQCSCPRVGPEHIWCCKAICDDSNPRQLGSFPRFCSQNSIKAESAESRPAAFDTSGLAPRCSSPYTRCRQVESRSSPIESCGDIEHRDRSSRSSSGRWAFLSFEF